MSDIKTELLRIAGELESIYNATGSRAFIRMADKLEALAERLEKEKKTMDKLKSTFIHPRHDPERWLEIYGDKGAGIDIMGAKQINVSKLEEVAMELDDLENFILSEADMGARNIASKMIAAIREKLDAVAVIA